VSGRAERMRYAESSGNYIILDYYFHILLLQGKYHGITKLGNHCLNQGSICQVMFFITDPFLHKYISKFFILCKIHTSALTTILFCCKE
jgi:hypothetical protein